jgi:hypothetical protein
MKTKKHLVCVTSTAMGKVTRALGNSPMTWSELRTATNLAPWLLRLVILKLSKEKEIEQGKTPRYWLTTSPPSGPDWLEPDVSEEGDGDRTDLPPTFIVAPGKGDHHG